MGAGSIEVRSRSSGADGKRIYERRPGVEAGRLGDEVIVLDPSGTMLRGLNRSAGRVLELVDGARDASAIALQIAREFDVSANQAEQDVSAFLEALAVRQLIELRGGG
jgi:hypothetical protein